MPTLEHRPKRTKTALERSIAKWEANTKAEYPHQFRVSSKDCPLCGEFKAYGLIAPCSYCPAVRGPTRNTTGTNPRTLEGNGRVPRMPVGNGV